MIVKTFGNTDKPVLMLLHGGGLSWWSFTPLIDAVKDDYFIVVPILKGHGENFNDPFISIEDQSKEIIDYINSNYEGKVDTIAGLSIGAQILCEILSNSKDICQKAIIESALLFPLPGVNLMTKWMYRLLFPLIKYRWFSRLQAKSLSLPDDMINQYYEDSCKMTLESLINISISNTSYTLKKQISDCHASVYIMVGEKELGIMKKSAHHLNSIIEGSSLYIAPNLKHGQLSICHQTDFISITNLMNDVDSL